MIERGSGMDVSSSTYINISISLHFGKTMCIFGQ